ncbi:GGDEF domain-containing protein [Pokkaliibacter sp. MBI-7]|uniref:GGDEF domain-containing protein n=1 Tax=Pokkaliibacter sp. MBI-7 TaxID=3040600 RepID=UPI00244B0D16|nr:GGDEF domain-containing protein [Pokkaliibacter sp. MBI-7]MDH2435701.1 GGDEF domain-containing protein [Pokkaliibacter sp. MBI-7]
MPPARSSSTLPIKLATLLLVCFIALSWSLVQREHEQNSEEMSKHLHMSAWLLEQALQPHLRQPSASTDLANDYAFLTTLQTQVLQSLNCNLYIIDAGGHLLATGPQGGPLQTQRGQSLEQLPGLKSAVEQLAQGAPDASYQDHDGTHRLAARLLDNGRLIAIADMSEPSWYSDLSSPVYILTLAGIVLVLLVWRISNRALQDWQRQSLAQSIIDPLTTLPNRRGFELLASQGLKEAKRTKEELSVLLINLDLFARVNLNYGTHAGDTLLKHLSSLLRTTLRASDILCRWNGDEFIVLLKNSPADTALLVAEKLRARVAEQKFNFSGEAVSLTVSIGVATLTSRDDLRSLLSRAAGTLTSAKEQGRDRIGYPHFSGNSAAGQPT